MILPNLKIPKNIESESVAHCYFVCKPDNILKIAQHVKFSLYYVAISIYGFVRSLYLFKRHLNFSYNFLGNIC